MPIHRRTGFRWALQAVATVALLCAAGCTSPWLNGFLSPHEVGNFRENRVNEIQQSISFRDKPLGVPGATDPTPDDLIATVEEYHVGPGDTLSLRLLDFLQLGVETELAQMVDELGYIDVPQIGWLRVDGMTTRQVQAELIQQAKSAGIFPANSSPTVTVQVMSRVHRTFNISGAISQPGEYPIIRPDLRLREAINQAGSLPEMVKTIYVFRNETREKRVKSSSVPPAGQAPTSSEPASTPPPVTPGDLSDNLSDMSTAVGSPAATSTSAPAATARRASGSGLSLPAVDAESERTGTGATAKASAPASRQSSASGLSQPASEVERDLTDAVAPATTPAKSQTGPSPPTMPTYIYVNNEFIEAPQSRNMETATQSLPAPAPLAAPRSSNETATSGPVNWEELAAEGQQRVLRIPAEKIRHGDPNYNVVVRHQDWIQLDPGQTGVFYIDGHVIRVGTYSLSGEEVTLTQAITSAGGLDPVAWPTRCEIRRRIDGNREEITQWDLARIVAGQDPDLFIKKDDAIRVGTHAIAPLLATIRNSFRLTYGFGFVYDRNFADIDSFYGKSNPAEVRRAERAARGLLN